MKSELLVLYTRLPGYFLACLEAFHDLTGIPVRVIRTRPDQLAPFEHRGSSGVTLQFRDEFSGRDLRNLVQSLPPRAMLLSGWVDADYLAVGRWAKRQGLPVVAGMDNQWQGTLRQRLGTLASPWMLHRAFTHLWVPGRFQYEYARRLGFSPQRILMGWYAADTSLFAGPVPQPKNRFLFAGRMVEAKGIEDLLAVAQRITASHPAWQFHLIGSGPLAPMTSTPQIQHQAFLQPAELAEEAKSGGVFILPSRFEPWGVVLQEFAAAGLPVIVSDAVGARDAFLREGYNGFSFPSGNQSQFLERLTTMAGLSSASRLEMGQRSQHLALAHQPATWACLLQETIRQWEST